MACKNLRELKKAIQSRIIPDIMKFASEYVKKVMKQELSKSEISTKSLRESIIYKIEGNKSTIYIDYDLVQDKFARQSKDNSFGANGKPYVTWGWFTNTYNGSGGFRNEEEWNGLPISFNLAKWIEEGQSGNGTLIGNQPIEGTGWFTNTIERLKKELPKQLKLEYHNIIK